MGIEANVEHCRTLAESSPSIVTPLNRYIGYENAAAVAKQALKEGKTIREVVIENGYVANGALTEEQLDAALDVLAMTRRPVWLTSLGRSRQVLCASFMRRAVEQVCRWRRADRATAELRRVR